MTELKTSVIVHPPHNTLVIRREWALRAIRMNRKREKTSDNERKPKREEFVECAAELLSVFEYHRNNLLANRLFKNLLIKSENKNLTYRDTEGFLPYSISYLEECLLLSRGKEAIQKALDILEEMQFISSSIPQEIVEHYASGVTKWYLLRADIINNWIQTFYRVETVIEKPVIVPQKTILLNTTEERAVSAVCNFHRHIHGKNERYLYGKERRQAVLNRLKEGRTYGQMAQAIIGNLKSAYHQGQNDKNKLYDDIALICSDEIRFEKHIGYAEREGITEEIANNEFQLFLNGKTSRYSKLAPKTALRASNEQTKPIQPKISPELMAKYSAFAMDVAPLINGLMPLPEIIGLIRSNPNLAEKGRGLVDVKIMHEAMLQSLAVFNDNPSNEIFELLKNCANGFCEMQKVNC